MRQARNVQALLDELEAAEKRIAEAYAGWGNCQLTMGVYCHAYEEAKTHIAELIHNHRVHAARLIDERIVLKERIAELEAREVAVKQFDDFQIVHYGGSEDYAKGYIDCQNNYNKALIAAGIGVKGE